MMPDGMMGGGTLMMLLVGLFGLLLLAFLIVGVVWMIRGMRGFDSGRAATAARQELDLRYARGELGRDEYLRQRADLDGPEG